MLSFGGGGGVRVSGFGLVIEGSGAFGQGGGSKCHQLQRDAQRLRLCNPLERPLFCRGP